MAVGLPVTVVDRERRHTKAVTAADAIGLDQRLLPSARLSIVTPVVPDM